MNSKIKVFKTEKEDGLAARIRTSGSVACVSKLEPVDPQTVFAQKLFKSVASKDYPVETLYPMRDILVTTGWNLNHDVFDNGETWIAKHTPVYHPLNFRHDEKHIIGTITTSQAVDDNLNLIDETLAIDELPDKFHILNGSVIYRVWQDEEQQKLIEKTIAEIEEGKWYVSMECVFAGFDYAVIRPDGSRGIIPRDEASAFLTKHLRQYGGAGVYKDTNTGQEFQLGRVLRNITFIGKGLVDQPANPESVIINQASAFVSSFTDLGYIKAEAEVTSTDEPERMNMSEQNIEVKRLEERVAELVKQNEALAAQLKDRDGQAVKAEVDGLKVEIGNRDKKIETLEASVTELTKAVNEMTKRAEDAETELSKLKAEKVEKDRLAVLIGKGATTEKANELVKKFSKFSDEDFNDIVETLSAAWKKPETTKTPEDVINHVKADKDVSLSTTTEPSDEDKAKERIAKASKYVSGFLRYNKNVPAVTGKVQE